jgi:hypothetical protein
MKLLFKLLSKVSPDTIDAYIRQRWTKPVGFEDLNLAFIDESGKAWYEFGNGMANPIKRIEQQSQFVSFLSARVSPEAMEIAYEGVTKAFNEGKYLEGLVIFKRFMDMRDMIIPLDVLINALAADFIREDESITDINDKIHQEKCDYLKKVVDNGDSFFFQLTAVKDLSERFKISRDSWAVISKGYKESLNELKEEIELVRSMNLEKGSLTKAQPSGNSSETT